ncbi:serine/threonine protein kinase [Streptomyces sp. 1114.5]|uniref:serine/threonine-protein kinase n=1 Tax=Streptomyces sp. 1114.5 TaxID=1938830 RepID=UPI000F212E1F|nr:serine/threonine-protein kinase [Streptomyces sp. 1114.5]RKT19077.1 serine/threonine protein kinase [Streptomyces sp. 1114.5]
MTDNFGRLLAGRYRLRDVLGRGGMGTVWRAHDEQLDREVAVKELRLPEGMEPAERESWIGRLDREARAAARLKHPGVITVHDRVAGEDGLPWIVMELVRGRSLDDLLQEEGSLPPERVARIGLQVLEALRAAHAAGITHRDIKPSNVLLEGGRVVLTDFGIAAVEGDLTLTRSGALLGTPAYMAPEQVRGLPATAESDLWALGATLYTALEGRPPFAGAGAGAVFLAIVTEEPTPAAHAGALAPLLTGLLRKAPADRLTAEAAHELLSGRALDTKRLPRDWAPPAASHPTPGTMRLAPPVERHTRTRRALLAVVLAAAVAVATWKLWPEAASDAGRTAATSAPTTTASSAGTSSSTAPAPTRTPTPTPVRTPTYTPKPAVPTLDRAAVDRVFQVYMNGLANHDMTALRSGTCPRLRSTLLGFALNGYYVARWQLQPYDIPVGTDQLSVEATVTQQDPNTGRLAGDVNYQWIVERDADQNYFVCGWLNQR